MGPSPAREGKKLPLSPAPLRGEADGKGGGGRGWGEGVGEAVADRIG